MSVLLTADIHLTDNPRDEDRWHLFPWIEKQIDKYTIKQICILGDLTDSKDRHSAVLVNRLVDVLTRLASKAHVIILRGNHDGIDFDMPFFGFASRLEGRITYVSKPTELKGLGLFLPCTKDYKTDWPHLPDGFIFTHNTFDGSIAENGTKLDGIPPSVFKGFQGKVWSGDVHTAQKVGKVIEYVGAPYPIKFGDNYRPRLVLLRPDGGSKDLHYPYKRKELIEISEAEGVEQFDFERGTQVKIRVRLKRSEFPKWKNMRAEIVHRVEQRLWELHAIELVPLQQRAAQIDLEEMTTQEPRNILIDFGQRKKLSKDMVEAGMRFLKGTT